jgi:hypothetical protein
LQHLVLQLVLQLEGDVCLRQGGGLLLVLGKMESDVSRVFGSKT